MSVKDYSYEECKAFLERHEGIIIQIATLFYSPDNYGYHEMVCDLSTYLWKIYCEIPPNLDLHDESAWVYTVIYHKALVLHRGESRRQRHLVYSADLSNLADDKEYNHYADRLYRLIDMLDGRDRHMVLMYLDKVPTSQIADYYGTTAITIRRRLKKICDMLRHLDSIVDDDNDDIEL